jgi:hypothetical protein
LLKGIFFVFKLHLLSRTHPIAASVSFLPVRRHAINAISVQDNEAMATGLTCVLLVLPQAEDQPDLSALRASLEVLLHSFFPLLAVFFLMHSLFSTNARAAHCRTKFRRLTINEYNRRAISGDAKNVKALFGGRSRISAQPIICTVWQFGTRLWINATAHCQTN